MRVKVECFVSWECPDIMDGDWQQSTPWYEVSSSLGLFDRLVKMRHRDGLFQIALCRASPFSGRIVVASSSPTTARPWLDLATRRGQIPVLVPKKFPSLDALEMFACEVWDVIQKYADEPGVNRE